jgi:hypothetical protein
MNLKVARTVRALKVLVVAMGVLIVAGVVTIIVTIASRIGASTHGKPALPASVKLSLPQGAHLAAVVPWGDRLIIRIERQAGGDQLLTYDPASGAVVQTIELPPAP